jgi:glutamate racemase
VQEACPMWVPIVENNEIDTPGADYFIQKNINNILEKDPAIDTLILGCTHYPLLINSIRKFLPSGINILEQGEIVSEKLQDYFVRHPEMERRISKGNSVKFLTTESTKVFEEKAGFFLGRPLKSEHIQF